ncbi:DUF7558 family protein [Halorussus litoreus]|uniref:DUF7558 family protein n=1 Tax=Halorussus litoreus TaxID=1710536 RepID=UPI000E2353F8|nr:hypothetical protein [Halorussus litoreus]
MQQTLSGCAFCDALPDSETGEARTWGKDELVTHPICVDCAIQERSDPDELDHCTCDGCGLVVDALPALTSFCVAIGHLEGTLHLCARCSPGGPATYWTRDLDAHVIE